MNWWILGQLRIRLFSPLGRSTEDCTVMTFPSILVKSVSEIYTPNPRVVQADFKQDNALRVEMVQAFKDLENKRVTSSRLNWSSRGNGIRKKNADTCWPRLKVNIHGCFTLPEPAGAECASQRRLDRDRDFPKNAAGKLTLRKSASHQETWDLGRAERSKTKA